MSVGPLAAGTRALKRHLKAKDSRKDELTLAFSNPELEGLIKAFKIFGIYAPGQQGKARDIVRFLQHGDHLRPL